MNVVAVAVYWMQVMDQIVYVFLIVIACIVLYRIMFGSVFFLIIIPSSLLLPPLEEEGEVTMLHHTIHSVVLHEL